MAIHDAEAAEAGEEAAQPEGFGVDCHHRREGIPAFGVLAGGVVPGGADSDGERGPFHLSLTVLFAIGH